MLRYMSMAKLSELNPGYAFISNKYITGLQGITVNQGERGHNLESLGEMK